MPMPCYAQGMIEQGGLYSSVAGLGAGLAASRQHGAVINRSYEAAVRAQQSAVAQTKAIEEQMKLGCKLEAAKQWENAEQAFKGVLQLVARRDGPGSRASISALEHLIVVEEAQNKYDEAINYEKTVVAFVKSAKSPDYGVIANQQMNLSNLLIQKSDYASAEPVLREVVAVYDAHPTLPSDKRAEAITIYNDVLLKLHKEPIIQVQPEQSVAEQPKQTDESGKEVTLSEEEAAKLLEEAMNKLHSLSSPGSLSGLPTIEPPTENVAPEANAVKEGLNQEPAMEKP